MESRDLIGLDRYPMPDSERTGLEAEVTAAIAALQELHAFVLSRDGQPMPADREEFYGYGQRIRETERHVAAALRNCGFHLLFKVDIGNAYPIKPEYPNMIPSRSRG